MRRFELDSSLGERVVEGEHETMLRITWAVLRLEEYVATPVRIFYHLEDEREKVHQLTSYSDK